MGMFATDNRRENELSRLVARILSGESSLVPDHYAAGMPALLLTYSAHPAGIPWERMRSAYARFERVCDKGRRYEILHTLSLFAGQMKGQSLHVWEPVFRCDSDFRLRSAAAHAAMTLASRTEADKLGGVRLMMDYIVENKAVELLDGAFVSCDMRLVPLVCEVLEKMNLTGKFWDKFASAAFSLPAMTVLTEFIETSSDEEAVDSAVSLLCRMPSTTVDNPPLSFYHPFPEAHPDYDQPQVIDAVTPIPAWLFGDTPPQVLHTWTVPEYLLRFLPRLEGKLTEMQKEALTASWGSGSAS